MITEFLIGAALVYGPQYVMKNRKKWELRKEFQKIMDEIGIANKSGETYTISQVYPKEYGLFATIHIPKGKDFSKLVDIKEALEINLKAFIELEIDDRADWAKMYIIDNPLNEDKKYEPLKQAPWQAFLGYDRKGKPIFIDMNKTAHLLIAGMTGKGKSRLASMILTNLAKHCNAKVIQLYFSQIRKLDFDKFRNLYQTQWYATTFEDTLNMVLSIDKAIDDRNRYLEALEVETIKEYNEKNRQKMKYKWLLMEEFSHYMPKAGDDKETVELKNTILSTLTKIVMSGRNVGIFVLCITQRSTATNIDPNVKSQMCRTTSKQASYIDSENVINISDATKLKDREFILFSDDYYWYKTPYIDRAMINELLKDCVKPIEVITPEPEPVQTEPQTGKKVVDADYRVVNENTKLTGIMDLEELKKNAGRD